jgi:hypothetical protein
MALLLYPNASATAVQYRLRVDGPQRQLGLSLPAAAPSPVAEPCYRCCICDISRSCRCTFALLRFGAGGIDTCACSASSRSATRARNSAGCASRLCFTRGATLCIKTAQYCKLRSGGPIVGGRRRLRVCLTPHAALLTRLCNHDRATEHEVLLSALKGPASSLQRLCNSARSFSGPRCVMSRNTRRRHTGRLRKGSHTSNLNRRGSLESERAATRAAPLAHWEPVAMATGACAVAIDVRICVSCASPASTADAAAAAVATGSCEQQSLCTVSGSPTSICSVGAALQRAIQGRRKASKQRRGVSQTLSRSTSTCLLHHGSCQKCFDCSHAAWQILRVDDASLQPHPRGRPTGTSRPAAGFPRLGARQACHCDRWRRPCRIARCGAARGAAGISLKTVRGGAAFFVGVRRVSRVVLLPIRTPQCHPLVQERVQEAQEVIIGGPENK